MNLAKKCRGRVVWAPFFVPFLGVVVLAIVAYAYGMGVGGAFLLDDFANLQGLSEIHSFSLQDILTFAVLGAGGDGGRPLALLTFALQYADWPGNPAAFKMANVGIHLLNCVLGFGVLFQLGRFFRLEARLVPWFALMGASFWALAPLNVSAVLYVVQRMALLALTFILAGFFLYILGRRLLEQGRSQLGGALVFSGLFVGTVLGVMSKENALLFPLWVLFLESLALPSEKLPKTWRWARWGVLGAPVLFLFGYLAWNFNTWIAPGYVGRDFTLGERLLSESRALVEYIKLFLLPRQVGLGAFHDDFGPSRGLFSPPATALSLLVILAMATGALHLRRRAPLVTLGIAWYFAGHLLESSVIPLELYFEHRNYFPMWGIAVVLAFCVILALKNFPKYAIYIVLLVSGWLAMSAGVLLMEAGVWGNPIRQAIAWADEHPGSKRAQEYASNQMMRIGGQDMAEYYLDRLAAIDTADPTGPLLLLELKCEEGGYEKMPPLNQALRSAPFSNGPGGALENLVARVLAGNCPALPPPLLDSLINDLAGNSNYVTRLAYLRFLQARLRGGLGDTGGAVKAAELAYAANRDADSGMRLAAYLISAGRYPEADMKIRWALSNANSIRLWRRAYLRDQAEEMRGVMATRGYRPEGR